MKPYKNNLEYLGDIQKLAALKLSACKNGDQNAAADGFRSKIKERAAKSGFIIPLEHIIRAYMLNEAEEYLLYTFFMYESDEKYRAALSEATGITRMTLLSLEALAMLQRSEDAPQFSYSHFTGNLLRLDESGGYSLKNEITRFILNLGELSEWPWLERYYPASGGGKLFFNNGVTEGLLRLVTDCLNDESARIITITGASGCGRRSLIRQIADDTGFPIMFIDCKMLAYGGDTAQAAAEIKTEGILTGGLICFRDIDAITNDAEKLASLLWGVKSAARLAFATSEEGGLDLSRWNYTVTDYALPMPDAETSIKLWEAETQAVKVNADLKEITDVFRLTPLQIKKAVQNARVVTAVAGAEEITFPVLAAACRDISAINIGALGRRISPAFKWKDLVLSPGQESALKNAVERVRFNKTVFTDWGFRKKTPYGAGVHILLHGPPGTGKTMAAQVISGELGLPVYKIDMSSVVSKYIGETEKSLAKIFEESENSNSILFFDEADALFGKRTEIKDSHDRHANLQVSFLLQKIEEHPGVVILATNFVKNFDEAFKRRFHFIIGFSMPDKERRKKIWENVFPPETPLEKDVDFGYLAELAMSGSGIKNAALSSAFYAAALGKPVGMIEILRAVKNEAEKTGGVIHAEEFFKEDR